MGMGACGGDRESCGASAGHARSGRAIHRPQHEPPAAFARSGVRRTDLRRRARPGCVALVLDLFDRYSARATFFCIGQRAAGQPALMREIGARGHSIRNEFHASPAVVRPARHRRATAEAGGSRGVLPRPGRQTGWCACRSGCAIRSPSCAHLLGLQHVGWARRGFDTRRRDATRVLAPHHPRPSRRGHHPAARWQRGARRPAAVRSRWRCWRRCCPHWPCVACAPSIWAWRPRPPQQQKRQPSQEAEHEPRVHQRQHRVVAPIAEMRDAALGGAHVADARWNVARGQAGRDAGAPLPPGRNRSGACLTLLA